MNAAEYARAFLERERVPAPVIAQVVALFSDYDLPYSFAQHKAFDSLLYNFLHLYFEEGDSAIAIFDSYLIK